jgi:hypothetical protein
MSNLTNSGFSILYKAPYSNATKRADLDNIFNQCKNKISTVCFGGAGSTNTLALLACAYCNDVSKTTSINTPSLNADSGLYWYFTPSFSFGFATSSSISQAKGDTSNLADAARLSWNLDGTGGYRLGSLYTAASLSGYSKYAFVRDLVVLECPVVWMVNSELNCTLTQNFETTLAITVDFGNAQINVFNSSDQATILSSQYNAVGNFTVKFSESLYKLSFSVNITITDLTTTTTTSTTSTTSSSTTTSTTTTSTTTTSTTTSSTTTTSTSTLTSK